MAGTAKSARFVLSEDAVRRKHPLAKCEECPFYQEGGYVPTLNPRPSSGIIVLGEAPGFYEATRGIPFTGPSGELLNQVLTHHGLRRDEIMITNACLCRPENNDDPPRRALEACAPRLHAEIEASGAHTIMAVGKVAAHAVLAERGSMRKMRVGPPKPYKVDSSISVIPTWHPAYSLRSPDSFPDLVFDFGKIKGGQINDWDEPVYRVLDEPVVATRALSELAVRFDRIVIDIECGVDKDNAFIHPSEWDLLCVGIAFAENKALVIGENALKYASVRDALRRLLSRTRIIAHNGKFDLAGLRAICGKQELWFDTMLAAYALDERPGHMGLKALSIERLGAPDYEAAIKQYIPRGGNYANIPREILYRYNAFDVVCTWALYQLFTSEFSDADQQKHDFTVRAANTLIELELNGIGFDLEYNEKLAHEYLTRIADLENQIEDLVGFKLNPRSVPQITQYYAAQGYFLETTNADLLKELEPLLEGETKEFTKLLLTHRKEAKLYGTYVKGLAKRVSHGKIFTTYLLHGTTSGRLASREPNLQNICFSDDTEVLTNVGWKLFKELDKTELVAQWNENGTIEFVEPEEYIELDYQGTMIHATAQGMDLLVTPDHRMASKYRKLDTVIEKASDWLKFGNYNKIVDRKLIRGGIRIGGKRLSPEDRLGLEKAIAFQADGCWNIDWLGKCNIRVTSERKRKQLHTIFDGEVRYYKMADAVVLDHNDFELNYWLNLPEKTFRPEHVLELCEEDLRFFVGAVMRWDGDFTRKMTYLQHEDRELAVDVVQAAALLTNRSTSWYKNSEEYNTVNVHHAPVRSFSYTNVKEVAYDGKIYCANVPSGFLVVRRNKLALVSGNCRDKPIRNQFVVESEDHRFIQLDYKQAEGRVITTLARDEYLRGIFADPERDLFNELCNQIFGIGKWEKEQRVAMKSIFYGNAYGRGVASITRELNLQGSTITNAETAKLMHEFNALIPDVMKWQAAIKHQVLSGEDLTTPYGRKRSFWLITDKNKADVLNEALSFLPQSIASDICLTALIRLQPMLEGLAIPRLTIHDAIVVECHESRVGETIDLMRTEMLRAATEFTDYVPFAVDATVATRLGEL